MNLRLAILLLLGLGMGLTRLPAQEPGGEPDELVQARRQFELQVMSKAQTLSVQFANALSNVAKDAGAEGDYDQALAAQRRREQLITLYSTSLDDNTLSNEIVLKANEARINGAVSYERNTNVLSGWRAAGSVAYWDKSQLVPGSYDVVLTYATADIGEPGRVNPFAPPPDLSTGGEFEFYEDSSLPGAEANRRTGQVSTTGGWTEWKTLTLPAIQITRTSARFTLKITKARGVGGVMSLKGIRLVPPSSASPSTVAGKNPQDAATEPVDEFAKLQQAHLERLKQAITPIVNAYTDTMKTLASKNVINDVETSGEYNAEARRAAQLLEDPQGFLSGPVKGPRQGASADGFHELRDVVFVQAKESSGDCFKVKQGSEEMWVRLLWVSCPPAAQKETKLYKEHADYFGISVEDAQTIGAQAREFTTTFLTGKNLTLVTRGTKDEAGSLLVNVRPEGLGDFAGVLVDNGLAIIKPSTRKGPSRQHEDSVLQGLKERENVAKARKIPPGGWGRKADQ